MTSFADWLSRQTDRSDSVGVIAKWLRDDVGSDQRQRRRERAQTPGETWAVLGGSKGGKRLRDAVHVARLEWERISGHTGARRRSTGIRP